MSSSWQQPSAPGLTVGPQDSWPTPPGYVAAQPFGPQPPTPPSTPGSPGRRGYVVGASVLLVGSLVAILWFFVLVASEDTSGFLRVPIPGDRKVDLSARTYALYVERAGTAPPGASHPTVHISGPNGDEPVVQYGSDAIAATYVTMTDRAGTAFATISPTVAGTYRVEVSADPVAGAASSDQMLAIGEDLSTANEAGYLGAVALGAVTFFAGIGIMIATAIRRRAGSAPAPSG